MSRPISARLLVHDCTYYKRIGTNANQVTTYETGVPLRRVRFEPPRSTGNQDLGEFKTDRFLMFVDGVVSVPNNLVFGQLDQIEFNGDRLTIRLAEPIYGNASSIHHWEIVIG